MKQHRRLIQEVLTAVDVLACPTVSQIQMHRGRTSKGISVYGCIYMLRDGGFIRVVGYAKNAAPKYGITGHGREYLMEFLRNPAPARKAA